MHVMYQACCQVLVAKPQKKLQLPCLLWHPWTKSTMQVTVFVCDLS